jgi:hypothetical protein
MTNRQQISVPLPGRTVEKGSPLGELAVSARQRPAGAMGFGDR